MSAPRAAARAFPVAFAAGSFGVRDGTVRVASLARDTVVRLFLRWTTRSPPRTGSPA
jgi:hypothetical protein